MAGLLERLGITVGKKTVLPSAPNGQIVSGALQEEVPVKVSKDHMFFGQPGNNNPTAVAMEQARSRALELNILRNAYDENKKAIRTTCVDPNEEKF